MYLHDYCERRDCPQWDDGNLGNFWTKIRDKVIKPVGRVVAAYYSGGASEMAFKAYDAKQAQIKVQKAYKAQMAQIDAMGNTMPPYPMPMDPAGQRAYAQGVPPSAYPPGYPPGYNAGYAPPNYAMQGVYAQPGQAYNAGQGAPIMSMQPAPEVSHAKLPDWAIPAGIGAAVLLVLASQRR